MYKEGEKYMQSKRLLSILTLLLTTMFLCSCGESKTTTGVKLPEGLTSQSDITYEEAIEQIKYDKNVDDIYRWTSSAFFLMGAIYCCDTGVSFSGPDINGKNRSTDEGVTVFMNELEESLKAEPEYSKYMSGIPDTAKKTAYFKCTDALKDAYQKYLDSPPTIDDLQPSVDISISRMAEYISCFYEVSDNYDATNYLFSYVNDRIYERLATAELYINFSEQWEKNMESKEYVRTPRDSRMDKVMNGVYNYGFVAYLVPEEIDIDFEIMQLETTMGMKTKLEAIIEEAFSGDNIKISACKDFVKEANRLFEVLRLHRPEYGDSQYADKFDFNLDKLEELRAKFY